VIDQEKILKKLYKALDLHDTKTDMINGMHQMGVSRHECMIVEMLLLGKDYTSIKRILLFTDSSFTILLDKLYVTLKEYKKKKQRFDKIKG